MNNIYQPNLYRIASPLHDGEELRKSFQIFINQIETIGEFTFNNHGTCFDEYDASKLNIIFVQTGGTENQFKELMNKITGPVYLLAQDTNNSLAATIEILTYLKQNHHQGEIISGDVKDIATQISDLIALKRAHFTLKGSRLGLIGEPSDWLISSHVDEQALIHMFGIEIVKISIEELIVEINKEYSTELPFAIKTSDNQTAFSKACNIYMAIRHLIEKYHLEAVTIRCFDLLGTIKNTSCLALAILNSEGYVATCEGDIATAITMMILSVLTNCPGFQANPSSLNKREKTMIFAHCTVPLKMVASYTYDTHFESKLGVAIVGTLDEGPATIFKLASNLKDYYVSEGVILPHDLISQLCRTQVKLKVQDDDLNYFLTKPLGNHHVIVNGRYKDRILSFLKSYLV